MKRLTVIIIIICVYTIGYYLGKNTNSTIEENFTEVKVQKEQPKTKTIPTKKKTTPAQTKTNKQERKKIEITYEDLRQEIDYLSGEDNVTIENIDSIENGIQLKGYSYDLRKIAGFIKKIRRKYSHNKKISLVSVTENPNNSERGFTLLIEEKSN